MTICWVWLRQPALKRRPKRTTSRPSSTVSTSDKQPVFCATNCVRRRTARVESAVRVFQAGQGPHAASTAAPTASTASGADDPGAAAGAGKGAARNFNGNEQGDQRLDNGEREEDLAHGDGRERAEEHSAGEQAQRRERHAGGEPGKEARAVAAEQNHEQNQQRRKGQRPENLDSGEIEIEVHLNLVWPARGLLRRPASV